MPGPSSPAGLEPTDLKASGDFQTPLRILMELRQADLRCLHGYGLSLWRLRGAFHSGRQRVFDRMLWLNPPDNQKASFIIDDVRDGKPWRPDL